MKRVPENICVTGENCTFVFSLRVGMQLEGYTQEKIWGNDRKVVVYMSVSGTN